MRARKRLSCSSGPTSSQNLMRMMPASVMYFSISGQMLRKRSASFSLTKPITFSTPARLYQLRSKMTISPPAGKHIWVFSRSEGAGNAATRKTRGLTLSVIALIVPPFPAAFEYDNDPGACRFHPILQIAELHLQLLQLLFVLLA